MKPPARSPAPFGVELCAFLRRRGVDTVFGIPGVHNQELYRGLGQAGIRHILARHEQGACFMADGFARLSGRPGIAFVITGPGLTNGLTAIGQAYSDSVPTLVIAACLDRRRRQPGSGYLHKMKNQQAAGDAAADWCLTAEDASEAFKLLDRAFQEFSGRRARPKIINLPVTLLPTPSSTGPLPRQRPTLPIADRKAVAECAELIRRSTRPLFIFGGGTAAAAPEARRVLGLTRAAAFTTYAGRGIVPADYGYSFGSYLARPESVRWLASADLVIAVGTELSEVDLWRDRLGHSAPMVRVDIDTTVLAHSGAELPIPGDARSFLADLSDSLEGTALQAGWTADEISDARRAMRISVDADRPGIADLADALWDSLPHDTAVFSDMTQFAYVAKETVNLDSPNSWHHPFGFGTLGYALPAAIGGKVTRLERPVLAIAGDYGFQFTMQELGTAAELGLALPVMIWDNQGLGEISDGMIRAQIAPEWVSPLNPDFSALAQAYGLRFARPDSAAELSAAVNEGFHAVRPTLIHADASRLIAAEAD